MTSTLYPNIAMVKEIHASLLSEFGGGEGIVNESGLKSALLRPQNGYYKDIFEEAAALMESLAINHAFVDGNKRISFFITDLFLRLNGYFIDCEPDETYLYFMYLLESGTYKLAELTEWLWCHSKLIGESDMPQLIIGANQRSLNLFNDDFEWCGRVDHLVDNEENFLNVFEITIPWYDVVAGYPVTFVKQFDNLQTAIDYIRANHKPNIVKESPEIRKWLENASGSTQ